MEDKSHEEEEEEDDENKERRKCLHATPVLGQLPQRYHHFSYLRTQRFPETFQVIAKIPQKKKQEKVMRLKARCKATRRALRCEVRRGGVRGQAIWLKDDE
ncbi:hypothetical protein E2C01_035058 [Portunus trituberculatus]|uniref:Uncharacterized protein n=1 Tax=Portunus trituberculatus TaxID=210409 RepID=A0A5B7F837_PORTR|nr:hypothetical protein [Portunus trituberculatus]